MLNIPVVEIFLCTLTAYLVARAIARNERWTWLLAGTAFGLAILAKHSSVLWSAALALGILIAPTRRVFASPWPWAGVAIAALLALPNVLWQVQNDFASLKLMRTVRGEFLAEQGRGLFLAGQLLYFHPFAIPVWVAGLRFGMSERGRAARPFAVLFVAPGLSLLVAGGKPYYLASAYPPMLAAGGVALERRLSRRPRLNHVLLGSLTALVARS